MKEEIQSIIDNHYRRLNFNVDEFTQRDDLFDSYFLSTLTLEHSDFLEQFIELNFIKNKIDITLSKPYQNKSWAIEYISIQSFIMEHLTNIICDFYGGACSVDQARFLYKAFFDEHFFDKRVSFNKDDYKYSYHIPETCSKENWINLIYSLMILKTGKSDKFIIALRKLKAEHSQTISTYQYVYDKTVNHLHYILNDWFRSKEVFINPIDPRFPKQEHFEAERNHNYQVLKDVHKMLDSKIYIWDIIEKLKEFKISKNFPRYKKSMTISERLRLKDKQDKGEIYLYYLDEFYNYIAIYKYKKELEKSLIKIMKLECK